MLSRSHRLVSSRDIGRVQKKGKTLNTQFLRIKTVPNELGFFRCTIIISNKLSKSAVDRNRKRRQLSAILRELKPDIMASADMIISPTPEGMKQEFGALHEDLVAGLTKIRFLK